MPHLLAAISPHGYGHAMQTCLVLNALRQVPDLRITLQTTVNRSFLDSRLDLPFTCIPQLTDFGMCMYSAIEVDAPASHQRYAALHENWPAQVTQAARQLEQTKPDVVLADVPYLTLAACAQAQIPAVALCSLNWADIYQHYCGNYAQAAGIHQHMLDAYESAKIFLQPQPHMPMANLRNRRSIGVLARQGRNRRTDILQQLGLPENARLLLVALGGLDMPLSTQAWPAQKHTYWLVPQAWQARRADMLSIESLDLPFIDILCSCDVLITKPGYGSFTEAACNGVPVLYVRRDDWPETPPLMAWLHQHTAAAPISPAQLVSGELQASVEAVLAMPRPPPPAASGAHEAAACLNQFL